LAGRPFWRDDSRIRCRFDLRLHSQMTLTDCGEEKPRRFRHATYPRAVGRALDSTCWSKAEVQLRCPARVSYFPNLSCIGRLSRIGQPTHAALNTDQTNGPRGAVSCLSASLAFSLSISSIFLRCLSRSNSSVSIWEMSLPMASKDVCQHVGSFTQRLPAVAAFRGAFPLPLSPALDLLRKRAVFAILPAGSLGRSPNTVRSNNPKFALALL